MKRSALTFALLLLLIPPSSLRGEEAYKTSGEALAAVDQAQSKISAADSCLQDAGKENDDNNKQASKAAQKIQDLQAEKEQSLKELQSGYYCSKCYRTATEIEKTGVSFAKHLSDVHGQPIPAPPDVIQQKMKDYDDRIGEQRRALAENHKTYQKLLARYQSCVGERQQAYATLAAAQTAGKRLQAEEEVKKAAKDAQDALNANAAKSGGADNSEGLSASLLNKLQTLLMPETGANKNLLSDPDAPARNATPSASTSPEARPGRGTGSEPDAIPSNANAPASPPPPVPSDKTISIPGANTELINLVQTNESLRQKVYADDVGKLTVGWGHLLTPEEQKAWPKDTTLTETQCKTLFQQDMAKTISRVDAVLERQNVADQLTPAQKNALYDFAFNMGSLKELPRNLTPENLDKIPDQLGLYDKAWVGKNFELKQGMAYVPGEDGKPYTDAEHPGQVKVSISGLAKRRQKEINLWKRAQKR